MSVIVIDFETKDPYIGRDLGAGWVYKYHNYQNCDFEVLCMAWYDGKKSGVCTDFSEIPCILAGYDTIVAHNASYDIGCLMVLGYESLVNDLYGNIVCTLMAAKLYDSSMMSYGLDFLCRKWLKTKKTTDDMAKAMYDRHVYPLTKKEQGINFRQPYEELSTQVKSRVKNWTMSNLDICIKEAPDVVNDYALQDCVLCYDLLEFLINKSEIYYSNPLQIFKYWSKLINITNDYTLRGLRLDNEALDRGRRYLVPKINEGLEAIYNLAGFEFNILSPSQITKAFVKMGLPTGKTAKGNPSVNKQVLESCSHPIAKLIQKTRKYMKAKGSTFDRFDYMQQYTLKPGEKLDRRYGRVHLWFKPLEAKTGRFSSNGQQVPKRDKEMASISRSMFVPEEGKKWYSLDFSNQEGRLQAHYAYKLGCTGADSLRSRFKVNSKYDLHQEVSDMVNVERTHAKAINLGISYGMGEAKLCRQLGLEIKKISKWGKVIEVAGEAGKEVLNKYHTFFPFLNQLIERVRNSAERQGYIRTIGGRIVRNDRAIIDGRMVYFYHKALNQLMQGSAFDQTAMCMIKAYEEGIPVQLTIHDELDFSSCSDEEVERLKDIMENTVKLEIPSVTDIGVGDTWWEACQ